MRFENALMVGVTLLVASACAPTVVMLVPERFPPTKNVEIPLNEPQGRPYVKIARLSIEPVGTAGLFDLEIDALIDKARKLGADAIIFGGSTSQLRTRGYKWHDNIFFPLFPPYGMHGDVESMEGSVRASAVATRFTGIPREKR